MGRYTLEQLYIEHPDKVSDKWSSYLSEYDRLFKGYRDKNVRLLEIGIQNGGSLEIWSKYFCNAHALIGCDINPDCNRITYENSCIEVIIGDANLPNTTKRVLECCPQFDIIIDDGSHMSSDIIKSFTLYFPHLVEGGLYVAEDLHCSYWHHFEGGLFDPHSSIAFFKRLSDIINFEHWRAPKARADVLNGIFRKYGCSLDEEVLSQIHSVEFVNSMCVVRKAAANENRLGSRIISGSIELVIPGHHSLHGISYENLPVDDQSDNPWTNRTIPPDEAILSLETQVSELDAQAADLKKIVAERDAQIDSLNRDVVQLEALAAELNQVVFAYQTSTCWKLSKPIRIVSGLLKNTKGVLVAARSILIDSIRLQLKKISSSVKYRGIRFLYFIYCKLIRPFSIGRRMVDLIIGSGIISAEKVSIIRRKAVLQNNPPIDDGKPLYHNQLGVEGLAIGQEYIPPIGLLPWFDPLNIAIQDSLITRPKINVLLPGLGMKNMSGGPNTVLIIAAQLAKLGHKIRLISTSAPLDPDVKPLKEHISCISHVPNNVVEDIEVVDASDRGAPVNLGRNDIFLATAWWTAQMAKHAVRLTNYERFIYVIQDYEPLLHAASSQQALASETYSLNFVPVINTRLLFNYLCEHKIGRFGDSDFASNSLVFEPAVSSNLFYPPSKSDKSKRTMLFYARPATGLRNLFEIGVAAIQKIIAEGRLDASRWNIFGMGEQFAPVDLGHNMRLEPLPWMGIESYAEQIRQADILLSLMLSPHPSYPPLEMAATGGIAVTNTFSTKTADRLTDISNNILAADSTYEDIADKLEAAVKAIDREVLTDTGRSISLPTTWEESLDPIIKPLDLQIRSIQKKPVSIEKQGDLLNSNLRGQYGEYRKNRLAVRRKIYREKLVTGLIGFITTVWNTKPEYIECLAQSVFLQDGGTDFEWIILDNGSTNHDTISCIEALRAHPCVKLFRVDQNLGIIGGMRFCLEHSSARYVLPLDSDDYIYPDCVRVVTGEIIANNFPPLLYTDEDKVDGDIFFEPYFKPDWDPVLFSNSCYIAHLCIIKRELAIKLGCYTDPTVEGSHDWDTFTRFYSQGYTPEHIPEVLYSWRVHQNSTSGNIACKSYIFDSQRSVLTKFLNSNEVGKQYELQLSPLFNGTPDHWIRRKSKIPANSTRINWVSGKNDSCNIEQKTVIRSVADLNIEIKKLPKEIEYIHLVEAGIEIRHADWSDDWYAYFELFPDTVAVGGQIHDGKINIYTGGYIGFGWGCGCPDTGRMLCSPGYFAQLWKPHSVNSVSSYNIIIQRRFLEESLALLINCPVSLDWLGCWLGAEAKRRKSRIVYTPFLEGRILKKISSEPEMKEAMWYRLEYRALIPECSLLSPRLALWEQESYLAVKDEARRAHLEKIMSDIPSYESQLSYAMRLRNTLNLSSTEKNVSFSIITTIYSGTKSKYFQETISSVRKQVYRDFEWIILSHGNIDQDLQQIIDNKLYNTNARIYQIPNNLGIIGGLKFCLNKAKNDYIIPLDSDDLLTDDALMVFNSAINRYKYPEYIYSDEDIIEENGLSNPYFRPDWDYVLNMISSFIWHPTAFKRETAIEIDVFSNKKFEYCHDWDTVTKFAENSYRIVHIPFVLHHWRRHSTSISNSGNINQNSIISVKHRLEDSIKKLPSPDYYEIAAFPISRGIEELTYIRKTDSIPNDSIAIVVSGSRRINNFDISINKKMKSLRYLSCNETLGIYSSEVEKAILEGAHYVLYLGRGLELPGTDWLDESIRLIDSNESVVMATGRCIDTKGNVLTSGYVWEQESGLISISKGSKRSNCGPYAIWLKPHRILCPNLDLYVCDAKYLKNLIDKCPRHMPIWAFGIWAGYQAFKDGKIIGYSPLIEAFSCDDNYLSMDELSFQQRINRFASSLFANIEIPRMSIVEGRIPR